MKNSVFTPEHIYIIFSATCLYYLYRAKGSGAQTSTVTQNDNYSYIRYKKFHGASRDAGTFDTRLYRFVSLLYTYSSTVLASPGAFAWISSAPDLGREGICVILAQGFDR